MIRALIHELEQRTGCAISVTYVEAEGDECVKLVLVQRSADGTPYSIGCRVRVTAQELRALLGCVEGSDLH